MSIKVISNSLTAGIQDVFLELLLHVYSFKSGMLKELFCYFFVVFLEIERKETNRLNKENGRIY